MANNTVNFTSNMGLVGNANGVAGSWDVLNTNEVLNGFICKKGVVHKWSNVKYQCFY